MSGKRKTKSLSTLTPRSFRCRVANEIKDDLAHYSTIAVTPNDDNVEIIQFQSVEFNYIHSNESCSDELFSDNSGVCFESDSESENASVNIHGNELPGNFSYSEDSCSNTPLQLKYEVANWAVEFKIKHNAVDAILVILNKYISDQTLPKCAKTLLKTPRNTKVRIVEPRIYRHLVLHLG